MTYGQQIYETDCNAANPWANMTARTDVQSITVQAAWTAAGTIDVLNTMTASDALRLTVNNSSSTQNWTAILSIALIPVNNSVSNLGLLTLSFDHSVTHLRPVSVQIESFDANQNRTGGLAIFVAYLVSYISMC